MVENNRNIWYPFESQKEFLEVVMRHTAFMAMCLSTLYPYSELETLEKIYDSDFYDALEHIESDNYRISSYWSYYQICLEFHLEPVEQGRPIWKEVSAWYGYLIYVIEYLKLFFVNKNGLSPSGGTIFRALKKNGLVLELSQDYSSIAEENISEFEYAKRIAKRFQLKGYSFRAYNV